MPPPVKGDKDRTATTTSSSRITVADISLALGQLRGTYSVDFYALVFVYMGIRD
jgi:hypothetical protein